VELDTNQNPGEIYSDHIQVVSTEKGALSNMTALENIETGNNFSFRVTWDTSNSTLKVYLGSSLRLTLGISSISDQLPGNPDTAYFGFTAATGGRGNTQIVCVPEQEVYI